MRSHSLGIYGKQNANHTDDSGEIMIRQEGFILKPASDASVVVRTRRFLGREYQYCLQTPSSKKLHARSLAIIALRNRMRVAILDTSQSDHFRFSLLRVIEG